MYLLDIRLQSHSLGSAVTDYKWTSVDLHHSTSGTHCHGCRYAQQKMTITNPRNCYNSSKAVVSLVILLSNVRVRTHSSVQTFIETACQHTDTKTKTTTTNHTIFFMSIHSPNYSYMVLRTLTCLTIQFTW